MTTRFLLLLIPVLFLAPALQAQSNRESNIHIGFIYPVSSNGKLAGDYTNHCSFHAIAGLSGNEDGATFAGFANIIRNHARGAQFAGFLNYINGTATGGQFAGFMNYTGKTTRGIQAAGFANITGNITGAQLSGFTSISRNHAQVQASGFMSLAKTARMQLSGFINIADRISGAQLGGFINTAKNVKGTQVAGFINVAKKVTGVQLAGFINIADSSEYPIGLINIVKNGEMSIGATIDETLTGLVTFRSGGKYLYGILGAGLNVKENDALYALEGGLGLHVPLAKNFRVNMESTLLVLTDFEVGHYFRTTYKVLPAVRAGRFGLFAGPTFNCVTLSHAKGVNLVSNYAYERKRLQHFAGLYFGAIAGIQFML